MIFFPYLMSFFNVYIIKKNQPFTKITRKVKLRSKKVKEKEPEPLMLGPLHGDEIEIGNVRFRF